jgi:hypothetical protein
MDDYANRVDGGLQRLERQEIAIRQDVARTQQELVRMVAELELEMEALHHELAGLEGEMKRTVERAKSVVNGFKPAVKRGDLMRLQNRIDIWAPEQRISREQFKRMLEEAMSN